MGTDNGCVRYLEALELGEEQSAEFQKHLATCSECREGLAALGGLAGKIAAMPNPAPVALKASIMERVATLPIPGSASPAGPATSTAPAATGSGMLVKIAVVLGLGALILAAAFSGPSPSPAGNGAVVVTPSTVPAVASAIPPLVDFSAGSGSFPLSTTAVHIPPIDQD